MTKLQHRYTKATRSAQFLAVELAAELHKYAVPVEDSPRKRVLRRVNPLNVPDDAGASYGSNYGSMS